MSYDKQYAHVLRLLKDIFTVQSPACNIAPLLRPHVVKIVMLCLQRAKEFRDTDREGHYLQLVRFLFVCIAGHAELSTQFSPHIVGKTTYSHIIDNRFIRFAEYSEPTSRKDTQVLQVSTRADYDFASFSSRSIATRPTLYQAVVACPRIKR